MIAAFIFSSFKKGITELPFNYIPGFFILHDVIIVTFMQILSCDKCIA